MNNIQVDIAACVFIAQFSSCSHFKKKKLFCFQALSSGGVDSMESDTENSGLSKILHLTVVIVIDTDFTTDSQLQNQDDAGTSKRTQEVSDSEEGTSAQGQGVQRRLYFPLSTCFVNLLKCSLLFIEPPQQPKRKHRRKTG